MSLAALFPLMSAPFVPKWFPGSLNASVLVQLGLLVPALSRAVLMWMPVQLGLPTFLGLRSANTTPNGASPKLSRVEKVLMQTLLQLGLPPDCLELRRC